jgi:hypothetical protein
MEPLLCDITGTLSEMILNVHLASVVAQYDAPVQECVCRRRPLGNEHRGIRLTAMLNSQSPVKNSSRVTPDT